MQIRLFGCTNHTLPASSKIAKFKPMRHQLDFEKPIVELQNKLEELKKHPETHSLGLSLEEEVGLIEKSSRKPGVRFSQTSAHGIASKSPVIRNALSPWITSGPPSPVLASFMATVYLPRIGLSSAVLPALARIR